MQNKFEAKREKLINNLINEGYLKTPKIIEAFRKIPRHLFILERDEQYAYVDYPLQIYHGQTISAPSMVAIMLELLKLKSGHKVLEVGTGSGWNAALIGYIIGRNSLIYTIELIPELIEFALKNLNKVAIKNVKVVCADGSLGYEKESPYDKIIVTCACPEIPKFLLEQLKENGIMIIPVGSGYPQELLRIKKTKKGIKKEEHGAVSFVPLRKY